MINLKLFELVLSFFDEITDIERQVALLMCPVPVIGKDGELAIFSLEEIHTEIAMYKNGVLFNVVELTAQVTHRGRMRFVDAVESFLGYMLSAAQMDIVLDEAMRGRRSPAEVAAMLQQRDSTAANIRPRSSSYI